MEQAIGVIIVIGIMSVLPIYVAHQIGTSKNRLGWVWGFLLGWLGVIVVALLPPKGSPVSARERLEWEQRQRWLDEQYAKSRQ
jgi:hypothetical protein